LPVEIDLGQLVCSRTGRDQGRYYLVVGWHDARRVKLVDGYQRPVNRPKVKNVAHLERTGCVAPKINKCLLKGEPITNEMVRAELGKLCHDLSRKEGD